MSRFARRGMALFGSLGVLLGFALVAYAVQTTPDALCPPAPPTRLIVNERGRVALDDTRPLNLRADPGTTSAVLAQIPAGGVFYVLDGATCGQDYAWFQVEYNGIVGWVAEGDEAAYYAEIYPPGW